MKRALFSLMIAAVLGACASPPGTGTAQPPLADQVGTMVAATLQALPPTATVVPACPGATKGTEALRNEEMGFCLLHPDGYDPLDPVPAEVCLVPEGPTLGCHNANAFINIEDAAGRTAGQVADAMIADAEAAIPGIVIERASLTVSEEEAVVLEGLPGVGSSRHILVVHGDRLYRLVFVPWDEGEAGFAQVENLHDTVIDSFQFLP